MDPYFMFGMALIWPAIGVTGLAAGIYFARRRVLALERRGHEAGELAELRQRITHLEEALETTQRDVSRLDESQEFTTRLLASRAPPASNEL